MRSSSCAQQQHAMAEQRYRELLPARSVAAATGQTKSVASPLTARSDRRQAILVACEPCRRKKCKCDGKRPICGTCIARETQCTYDGEPDARRSVTLKRKNEALVEEVKRMRELLESMRSKPQSEAVEIFQHIRSSSDIDSVFKIIRQGNLMDPPSDVDQKKESQRDSPIAIGDQEMQYLQAALEPGACETDRAKALSKLPPKILQLLCSASNNDMKQPRRPSVSDQITTEYRRVKKAMTVQELCKAPFVVTATAAPWTTVTSDDNLVSHLLSVYFTWQQPGAPIIHRDAFFEGLSSRNINSPYCSPLLVNIILSIASDGGNLPDSITSEETQSDLGHLFFAEAKRLWEAENGRVSLTNIQSLFFLCYKHGTSGHDRSSKLMFSQAITMAEELGIHKRSREKPRNGAEERHQEVCGVVSWGLILLSNFMHLALLRPSPLKSTEALNPFADGKLDDPTVLWSPYPLTRPPAPAHYRRHFAELINLSKIANEALETMYSNLEGAVMIDLWDKAIALHARLSEWVARLPPSFAPKTQVATHILIMRMLYHNIIIATFSPFRIKLPIQDPLAARARSLCLNSAEQIASILRIHRDAYGRLGSAGVLQFGTVSICTFLDLIREKDSLPGLIHDSLIIIMDMADRVKLGKGILRVIQERAIAVARSSLFPETIEMLNAFLSDRWKPGDFKEFSSMYPLASTSMMQGDLDMDKMRLSDLMT